jgi:hypothetical protein
MFNMQQQGFTGPQSLDDTEAQLKKNKMLAGMLGQQMTGASQQDSGGSNTAAGLNIANSLVSGLGSAYLMNKNGADENFLKKNKAMAGLLGG